MNHPDFRIGGKIFATLGYPNNTRGMVKLPPEQQQNFVDANPEAFLPVKGAWGLRGATSVVLESVTEKQLKDALLVAWESAKAQVKKPRGSIRRRKL